MMELRAQVIPTVDAGTRARVWRFAMMGWGYGMGGGWLVMTLSWLLLIVAIIALVVWIFPRDTRRGGASRPVPGPREVLDQRLARGEIDVETYRTLRHELAGTDSSRQ